MLRDYLGGGRATPRRDPVVNGEGLAGFLYARASHVSQTSLYGYIRTRAGSRYPELFADDAFMVSMNIAKWQIWAACLSDLTLYAGGLILQRTQAPEKAVRALMCDVADAVFAQVGTPDDAGDQFAASLEAISARIMNMDWRTFEDDETVFRESPDALVQWAPIIDELKELDSENVRNSVRFRWQEIRRDLRHNLNAGAVMDALQSGP
ncbi:MAG: hypothetical protein QGI13_15500 [Rhodospirillales bacterium]|jgi:hypothetical protein|nr:hypothetical protein [Rhodospirillales bacterium]